MFIDNLCMYVPACVNLHRSAQLKSFWNRVFDVDPRLIPSLESTLVDIGRQIKDSKDSLQLLERHLKKYVK